MDQLLEYRNLIFSCKGLDKNIYAALMLVCCDAKLTPDWSQRKMAEWTKYVDESALSVPVLQAFSLSASLLSLRHTQFCMSLPFKGAFLQINATM